MPEFELVHEIQNLCRNNQMRDVFFEEVTCEDPESYVRGLLKGKDIQLSVNVTGPDSVTSGVKSMMKLLDYHEIGGTQLLGITKPVIKAHGSSDALAFRNAVKQAMDAVEHDVTPELQQALGKLAAYKEQTVHD